MAYLPNHGRSGSRKIMEYASLRPPQHPPTKLKERAAGPVNVQRCGCGIHYYLRIAPGPQSTQARPTREGQPCSGQALIDIKLNDKPLIEFINRPRGQYGRHQNLPN